MPAPLKVRVTLTGLRRFVLTRPELLGPVLLRVRREDPLVLDAQAEPLPGELGESMDPGDGKGHPIVRVSYDVISYIEMCRREGASLQQGMNFGLGGNHSVILMSLRPNAPYHDRIEDGGTTLIYEGHDHPKTAACGNPKAVDQPEKHPSGGLTQNGKFHQTAQEYKGAQAA
jgi:hypothetical protein